MTKKRIFFSLLSFFVFISVAYAANDNGWINPITTTSGLSLPAPGLKLTEHADAPTNADLSDGVIYADTDDNLYYRAGGAWIALTSGGTVTLDGAFDNGKIINGANSTANAVQIGDGTDAVLVHTEAANDVRITTNGTSDLTIAPDGGDTDITGTLGVTGNLTVSAGDLAVSAGSVSATFADAGDLANNLLSLTAGTGDRVALVKIDNTGTDSVTTSHVIDINQTGILDSNIIDITYDTGASTGNAVDVNMGTNVVGAGIDIATAGTGTDNDAVGILVAGTGALVEGANLIRVTSSGNMAGTGSAVVEIEETGAAQGTAAALTVSSTNNYALEILSGKTLVTGGFEVFLRDTAVGIWSQADTFVDIFADGAVRIGDSAGGAPTNYANFGSDGSLTFTGTARRTKKVWLGSEVFKNQVTATEGVVAAGFKHSWEMTDGAADYVTASWYVPDNWVSGTDISVYIHWSSPATTLVGTWDLHYVALAEGEDTTGAGTNLADIDDTSNGTADYTNITTAFTIASADIAAGDMIILRPGRVGNAANDTLADIADFHGLQISYTANTW